MKNCLRFFAIAFCMVGWYANGMENESSFGSQSESELRQRNSSGKEETEKQDINSSDNDNARQPNVIEHIGEQEDLKKTIKRKCLSYLGWLPGIPVIIWLINVWLCNYGDQCQM